MRHPRIGRRQVATLAVAGVLLGAPAALGGCGGASEHRARPGARGSQPPPGPTFRGYRWLVQTSGPQPSTAFENRARGSRGWRLPGPAEDVGGVAFGSVRGYVAHETIAPGQMQRFYVSSPGARHVRIDIFRIGWYQGTGGRQVLASGRLRARRQPACIHRFATGLTECPWHPALSLRIPPALPSGVYVAKLSAATGASDCLFVVTAAKPTPLLAQLPTATYQAYNAWGGNSLYPGGSQRVGVTASTQAVEVSYQRPYDSITGAGQFFARDVALVRFLERYRYPVSYTTSEGVDQDPGQLTGHRALIDFGHSEYWSDRQVRGFTAARDHGTSLLFLSSNTLAWRVRFAATPASAGDAPEPDHRILAYKEHAALDPDRSQPTGAFGAAAAALTGSRYLGCITPRIPQPGPPTYRLYQWMPARGLRPDWLFRDSGLNADSRIPGIVGYELDAPASGTPAGTQLIGGGTATCMAAGASDPGAPAAPHGAAPGTTTLYQASSGALVFTTGTLSWELGLEPVPSASPQAPRAPERAVVAITRNLLARVLGTPGGP